MFKSIAEMEKADLDAYRTLAAVNQAYQGALARALYTRGGNDATVCPVCNRDGFKHTANCKLSK